MIARVILAIVLNAAVQSGLVWHDPVPEFDWTFPLLATASAAAVVVTLWEITAIITGHGGVRLLGYTAVVTLAIAATAVVVPILVPIALIVGLALISALACGINPIDGVRRRPGRAALSAGVTAVAVLVLGLASIAFGFLVTGVLAAALSWLLIGAAVTGLTWLWRDVWT